MKERKKNIREGKRRGKITGKGDREWKEGKEWNVRRVEE